MLLPGPALTAPSLAGQEITYQTFAVPKTVNGTGVNVLTTAPFVCDGSPVIVEFFIPRLTIGASGWFFPAFSDDVGGSVSLGGSSLPSSQPYYGIGRYTPAAGTRTFTITAATNGVNATLESDAPFWIRVTKVGPAPISSGNPGQEIGYDQITSLVPVTSTVEATGDLVIPGTSHVFDGLPVFAEFYSPFIETPNSTGFVVACLFEGPTEISRLGDWYNATGTAQIAQSSVGKYRFTPLAGAHTYDLRAFVTGSGIGANIGGGVGGVAGDPPAYLRFTKV